MKSLAVILTVFNRKSKTILCLQKLYEQKLSHNIEMSIFITDGGSTDGTVNAIRKEFPSVNIEVRDGLFWNRGMYHSWKRAAETKKYDFYLWLNDDVNLYDFCIQDLFVSSAKTGYYAIIVGSTVDSKTKTKLTYGGRIKGQGIPKLNGVLTEVDYFNGNIVLIPANVFDQLGNLDYYFTHSKGDFDYGQRAKRKGIKMYQVGTALGECDEHPRIDKWCDPEIPLLGRLRMLYKPNGMPPHETFHLEKKNNLAKAIFHYFTVHIRCVFPQLWTRRRV